MDGDGETDAKMVIAALRQRRIRIVSVEGSIGAGKSRLMQALHAEICAQGLSAITAENRAVSTAPLRYLVVPEPVKSWTEEMYETEPLRSEKPQERCSILELFYRDMRRWGFLFQVKAFTSRLRLLCRYLARLLAECTEQDCEIIVVSERSLLTDRIFFRNLYECGLVTPCEWAVYNEFYDTITTDVSRHHDVMLYVDTPPAKCDERVKLRGRPEEQAIPLQYLAQLHDQHQRMMSEFVQQAPHRQVLHVAFSDDLTQRQIDEKARVALAEFSLVVQRSQ